MEISIHSQNNCHKQCPALFTIEIAIRQSRVMRNCEERIRVFSMLSDDQQNEVMASAEVDLGVMIEGEKRRNQLNRWNRKMREIALAYKYACALLGIEPKTGSIL